LILPTRFIRLKKPERYIFMTVSQAANIQPGAETTRLTADTQAAVAKPHQTGKHSDHQLALRTILLCLLATLSPSLWALSSDSDQSISVEADNLEIRENDNISIYQGNVTLVQGSVRFEADKLIIHFNADNELVLMEMTGLPVKFRQLDDDNQEMQGEARRMNYNQSESLLEMFENARFSRSKDVIESDLIRINTDDNSIEAGSNSKQRVKMLIQPKHQ